MCCQPWGRNCAISDCRFQIADLKAKAFNAESRSHDLRLFIHYSSLKLPKKAKDALVDQDHEVFVSNISLWEISLKYALGKLVLRNISPEELLPYIRQSGFEILLMNEKEAATYHQLPQSTHRDPFDRMLIWQAIQQGLYVMTRDKDYKDYEALGLRLFKWR